MINDDIIKDLLRDVRTVRQASACLDGLYAYFDFMLDPRRDESKGEEIIEHTKSTLSRFNDLASSISLNPVYIDEGNLKKDMADYFAENLRY